MPHKRLIEEMAAVCLIGSGVAAILLGIMVFGVQRLYADVPCHKNCTGQCGVYVSGVGCERSTCEGGLVCNCPVTSGTLVGERCPCK